MALLADVVGGACWAGQWALLATVGLGKAGRQGAPAQTALGGQRGSGSHMVLLPNESASGAVSAPCASSEFGRVGHLFGVPHIEADARWSCFVLACVMEHHLLKEMEECDFQW